MKRYPCNRFAVLAAILFATPVGARDVAPLSTDAAGVEKVSATVGDHRGTFLFDSGFGTSAVTPAFAALIGCKPWAKVTGFRATGERLDLPRCNATKITIGASTITMPQLSVIDLSRFMGAEANGLSGAIGLDALAGRIVTLDVANHKLVIEDTATLVEVQRSATEVPIRLVRGAEGAALTVDMAVPTASGPAWMELDTGNYGPSMVDKSVAGLFGLDPASPNPQQWHVPVRGALAVSGPVVVKDLILDGNLGRDVLRHWLVTLDLANGRGWIKVDAAAGR